MEIGRQAAGCFDLRLVAKFGVRRQFRLQEPSPPRMGSRGTSNHLYGRHVMVDRQLSQGCRLTRQQTRCGGRPTPSDRGWQGFQTRKFNPREWIRLGRIEQVLAQGALQESPKGVGRRKCRIGCLQRQQAVPVDFFDAHRQLGVNRPYRGQWNRIIVRHNHAGMRTYGFKEPAALARLRLDVGIVHGGSVRQLPGILLHALQNEAVVAVGVPPAARGENFKDHQRSLQLPGPADRPLKGKVPSRPPRCRHPVDDELAIHLRWSVAQHAQAECWDRSNFVVELLGRSCQALSLQLAWMVIGTKR